MITASDGKKYNVICYSSEMILAIGYRVRTIHGVQFRQWASHHPSEHLIKGFTINDERPKNPNGLPDYYDELCKESVTSGQAKTYDILQGNGRIFNSDMEKYVRMVYDKFNSKRKLIEAEKADAEGHKWLENFQNKIKNKE